MLVFNQITLFNQDGDLKVQNGLQIFMQGYLKQFFQLKLTKFIGIIKTIK